MLAYAIFLLIGTLGVIALALYAQSAMGTGLGIFLLLCDAVFCWGARRAQDPREGSGHEGHPRTNHSIKSVRSLRQWALIITGAGAGIIIATLVYAEIINRFFWSGVPIGLAWALNSACLLALGGLITFLVDGLLRSTGRRY